MIKKVLIICWLLVVGCWLFAKPVLAKDFSSFYKATYTFDEEGRGFSQQEISLVNERPDLYVSEYTLSLNGTHIENIQAFDKVGPIKVNNEIKDDTTLIKLMFNEKEVGKGKILSFILKYQTSDLAQKKGNLWEISIPKLGNATEIDTYQAILKIPVSFGNAAFINPRPDSEEKDNKYHILTFNKDKLSNFGVLASFGKWQTFKFSLDYELLNETSSPGIGKIALPPDTAYQNLFYSQIIPEPENVEIDQDGNWMASFIVPSNTILKINAQGTVNIFATRKNDFPMQTDKLDHYQKENLYWEVNDPKIKEIIKDTNTPKEIYNYVVKTLSYNEKLISAPQRKGALAALKNPQDSLCSEFTDLFVTLCRAAGIPARELEGFAYSDNPKLNANLPDKDILHSWAEYYDTEKGYWVMVDPTFGSTAFGLDYFNNFDMNHFAFVIHGENSREPFPAGSYKTSENIKQVAVSFGSDSQISKTVSIILKDINPKNLYSLKNNEIKFKLRNNSGFAVYDQSFTFDNDKYFPSDFYFSVIPPYGEIFSTTSVRPKENFIDYVTKTTLYSKDSQTIDITQKVRSLALRLIISGGVSISLTLVLILKSLKKSKKTE